jgi:hypothetical protein
MRRLLFLSLVVACSSYNSEPSGDAGINANDAGPVSAEAAVSVPGPALYVSGASGNDANSGRTQELALKTLGGALALIDSAKLQGVELKVCRGVYEETDARIRTGLVIRGGYNCSNWQRGDSFGKKGNWTDSNATRIVRKADSTLPAALTIRLQASETVELEGIEVMGAATAPSGSAIDHEAGTLKLRDVLASGADAQVGSTRGLLVVNATVDFERSEFRGGAGQGTENGETGSVAIRWIKSKGTVANSTLRAGNGVGILASAGVQATGDGGGALRIQDSLIEGDGAQSTPGSDGNGYPFQGLNVSIGKSALELKRNVVRGGQFTSSGPNAVLIPINVNAGDILFDSNRSHSGNTSGATNGYCYGMHLQGSGQVVLDNNAVQSGCESSSFTGQGQRILIVGDSSG